MLDGSVYHVAENSPNQYLNIDHRRIYRDF